MPWPLVSGESAGRVTPLAESLLLKWTVPAYEVTGLPMSSSATTVTLKACPEVTVAGTVSLRSFTTGRPVMKVLRMVAVVCWMRGSTWTVVLVLSRAQLHDMVPLAKTQALLGA